MQQGPVMSEATQQGPALWLRILQYPFTRLIVLGAVVFQLMAWTEGRIEQFKDNAPVGVAIAIAMSLAVMVIYVAWGKLIERREVTELSLPGAGREWAIGALIGAGLYTACVLLLMVFGMYRIEGLNPVSYMIPAVAMAVKSGVFEELLFRGVLFRSVEDMAGSWIAIVVSSLVFGLVHLLNPESTIAGAVYISIEAGLLLSAAYLVTRRLWIAIGFHMCGTMCSRPSSPASFPAGSRCRACFGRRSRGRVSSRAARLGWNSRSLRLSFAPPPAWSCW